MIYIPAISNDDEIFLEVQTIIIHNCYEKNFFITGLIDIEIEQSIYIILTLLKKLNIKIPDYIHIHFPDYTKLKGGASCSLGLFMILYTKILNINLKKRYMATGELDIYGNVREVGAIERKLELLTTENDIDVAFFSIEQQEDILKLYSNIKFIKNINELIDFINNYERY